jgi:hypothetical protein
MYEILSRGIFRMTIQLDMHRNTIIIFLWAVLYNKNSFHPPPTFNKDKVSACHTQRIFPKREGKGGSH